MDERDTVEWSRCLGGSLDADEAPSRQYFPEWTGAFEYCDVLGKGGFGFVFLALQRSLRRLVALKVLRPALAGDRRFVELLREEAYTMAAVRSPRVVTVHDFLDGGDPPFIFMEFVEGTSLSDHLGPRQERGRQARPLAEAIMIARWIAEALADLQAGSRCIAHRDLTPRNIMLCVDRVKLLDLGLARAAYRRRREGSPLGQDGFGVAEGFTLDYAAPEQILGQEAGTACDWFSFGVILFEMLSGRLPFEGPARRTSRESALLGRVRWDLLPEVPPACRELLERCLARAANDREVEPREAVRLLQVSAGRPSIPTPVAPRNNLPVLDDTVPLMGREREREDLARALRRGSNGAVVLHGMPGVGKTRLALEVAREIARRDPTPWSTAVVWVSLRGVEPVEGAEGSVGAEDGRRDVAGPGPAAGRDATSKRGGDVRSVREAIAAAVMSVHGQLAESSSLEEALHPLLEQAPTLLVIDNADRLSAAVAAVVSELRQRHERLRVLVTTIDPAPFPVTALHRLDPLRPPSSTALSVQEVSGNPAIELFVAFLREHVPGFRLTPETTPCISAICARLGGIPLAMRLVASTGPRFDPPRMLAHLDSIIAAHLPAAGAYASVEQILDVGLSSLSGNERRLLGRLSIFSGGWSDELAEAICADAECDREFPSLGGQPIWALLDWLERRGVVHRIGKGRRDVLDPLRRRAQRILDQSSERTLVEERFVRFMLALVGESIVGRQPAAWSASEWLRRLSPEGENLRTLWNLAQRLPEPAARVEALTTMVRGLDLLWAERGVPTHGLAWSREAVLHEADLPTPRDRMSLLNAAAGVAMIAGHHAEADALLARAAELAETSCAPVHKVIFAANRALCAARQDAGEAAIDHAESAIRFAGACGLEVELRDGSGQHSEPVLQAHLARAHGLKCLGRLAEARRLYRDLEGPLRAAKDWPRLFHVFLGQAQVELLEGRFATGRAILRQAREVRRRERGHGANRCLAAVIHAVLSAREFEHPSAEARTRRWWERFLQLGGLPGPFLRTLPEFALRQPSQEGPAAQSVSPERLAADPVR